LVMAHRRIQRHIPYSEIIYCDAPALLTRHLERVTQALMRRQHSIGLLSMHNKGIKRSKLSNPLYRSKLFAAHELDKLYSELVLLPV